MEAAHHSILDGVEVGVAHCDFISSAKDLGVVVHVKEGFETIRTDHFSVQFILDFTPLHRQLQNVHHSRIPEPIVKFRNDEVKGAFDIGLPDSDETRRRHPTAVTVSTWNSVGRYLCVGLAQDHISSCKTFSGARLAEQS